MGLVIGGNAISGIFGHLNSKFLNVSTSGFNIAGSLKSGIFGHVNLKFLKKSTSGFSIAGSLKSGIFGHVNLKFLKKSTSGFSIAGSLNFGIFGHLNLKFLKKSTSGFSIFGSFNSGIFGHANLKSLQKSDILSTYFRIDETTFTVVVFMPIQSVSHAYANPATAAMSNNTGDVIKAIAAPIASAAFARAGWSSKNANTLAIADTRKLKASISPNTT